MNDHTRAFEAALDTALSIVQEPSKPPAPVEIRYVDPNGDITDDRYLIVLFRKVGLLVDKDSSQTRTFPLAIPAGSNPDDARAVLTVAKELAARQGLKAVYFPQSAS